MKILFFLNRYPEYGGIEKVTEVLSDYLAFRGHNISILSLISNESAIKAKNPRISYFCTPSNSFVSKENSCYIKRVLLEHSFDIIIFQDSYAPIEDYLFNNVDRCRTSVFVVEHNTPNCGYLSFKYHFRNNIPRLRDILLAPYHYLYMRRATLKRHRKLYDQADKYILLSEKFKPLLFHFLPSCIIEDKIVAIPNPVTVPIPKYIDFDAKQCTLLFVGRFSQQKGIDMLLDIWKLIYMNHPQWTLKLVGGGQLESYILTYIKRHKMKNIEIIGLQKDTTPNYREASILCLTSVFEGWGLVLLEAMSYGCVPVAFQSYDSITDIIAHDKDGILVPPFNKREYANQLNSLIDQPLKLQKLQVQAYDKAQNFGINQIGKLWEDLFFGLNK